MNTGPYHIILASGSPRRKDLLESLGFSFKIAVSNADETPPKHIKIKDIPVFLAQKKANSIPAEKNEIIIAADTIVIYNNEIIGKASDKENAVENLLKLSGQKHTVTTGVCLKYNDKEICFSDSTQVYFNTITRQEINHYIQHNMVLDKAGSYGIQDWIGMIGIRKIEGSFYNVMGLPIDLVYNHLQKIVHP